MIDKKEAVDDKKDEEENVDTKCSGEDR